MLSEAAIKEAFESGDIKVVVRQILFGDDCWLFEQRGIPRIDTNYQTLKNSVSDALDINPKEVTLIGSAKIGFSMAPGKTYRPFRKGRSDLDLAIVAPSLFQTIWDALSEASLQGYTQYRDKHAAEVFSKFIVLESEHSYKSSYLIDVARRIEEMNRAVNENIKIRHKVNYRIYADMSSAEKYHIHGINLLRKELGCG